VPGSDPAQAPASDAEHLPWATPEELDQIRATAPAHEDAPGLHPATKPEEEDDQTVPWAMPQAVSPVRAESTLTTATQSPSARWSFLGLLAAAGTWLDTAFGWSKQTAQQVLDTTADTSGIQTLLSKFMHNTQSIGITLVVVALVVVLARKFSAAGQGRSF
jgi:hypothetical protein